MKTRVNKILTRIASILLVIALTIPAFGSVIQYAMGAGSYTSLGTNKALGSPILNPNFSADDWNKWEMITWGIFLSNFTTPFIDDYSSAFNLNSGYGSKGSGAKAINFGSGSDVANSSVIQDLLDYAVNQQSTGPSKTIHVSYNKVADFKITEENAFDANSTNNSQEPVDPIPNPEATSDPTENSTETNEADTVDPGEGLVEPTSNIRPATVKDLIFSQSKADNKTWAPWNTNNSFIREKMIESEEYVDVIGIKEANIPTFAVQATGGTYEKVLDYTDSYDVGLLPLIVSRGANGDYSEEFGKMMDKVFATPENYLLVLDCFGNICTQDPDTNTLKVILPAAANKHLTLNPSINLANSLVFNSCTKTTTTENLILHGGQSYGNWWATFFDGSDRVMGGLPAFSNKSGGINQGQAVLYFDTDTIVVQDALESGYKKVTGQHNQNNKYSVDIAKTFIKLYDSDINNSVTQRTAFKIEPSNIDEATFNVCKEPNAKTALQSMIVVNTQLVNQFSKEPDARILTKLKTDIGYLDIFGAPVTIPVMVEDGAEKNNEKIYTEAGIRFLSNWIYQRYNSSISTTAGEINSSDVKKAFNESQGQGQLKLTESVLFDSNGNLSNLAKGFIANRPDFYKITDKSKLDTYVRNMGKTFSYSNYVDIINAEDKDAGYKLADGVIREKDAWNVGSWFSWNTVTPAKHNLFGRTVKAYTTSDIMASIANVLGVREGTEFAVYSTYIYLTYLDWYGITNTSLSSMNGNKNTSNFNPRIFDENSDVAKANIANITNIMTEEQKDREIKDWTYMMLNPTEGREYRSNMIISGISDWIYDNYQKIVYGNASSYYDAGSGVTSRNSTGFMTISPYSENFMTAWFVNNYAYFSVILIGLFLVLTIVIGLLKKRKISWFLVSIFAMINMILILPATGEIVPLLSNNFVQNMFTDKMSYWAISEGVTNATMEADYVSGNTISSNFMGKLSAKEQSQVINMVKNLNALYLDRSLSIKQDISKKITQGDTSTFEDVQQLRSARWMLPMIMRQFTASDGSANYVYVPLGDKYDDLSNMYWYFKPEDAAHVSTVNAKQTEGVNGKPIEKYNVQNGPDVTGNRSQYFESYSDRTIGYDISKSAHKQKSYETSPDKNVHTFSYMLPEIKMLSEPMPTYSKYESYDKWATALATSLQNSSTGSMALLEGQIEKYAGKYSRFDRATVKDVFGFLWATENPFHYFYDGIKDSIPMDSSLGSVIGDLQGTYVKNEVTGKEVRKTFMHSNETGYVRDVLDLEEMFHNMIPYMYSVQIMAEGYGEVEGAFAEGELIEKYTTYKFQDKSWLFRSNWVTKMMENKDFNKSSGIRLADGTRVKVANMMLPECYEEAGRPMIFSEAQMKLEGLSEADLSLIELKCIKVNKDVSQQWTLMLNYASVKGMTKEVVIRQMALDSLMTFNSEFNPVGVLSGAYSMYPNSIDLRSISFDSVMKMLMLNVTHDTSYIYGDTMQTLVEDSDIFTSFLLLATAFICAFLIPLARNLVMGLIFFLGFWGIIWSIFRTTKDKAKISCGFIISNFAFMAMTFVYYLAFKAIMAMTATDEVLSLSQIEINTGNPVWCLIFVLIVSLAYCVGIYKMMQFCLRNYRDMGFEVYAGIAEMTASSISSGIDNLASKLSGSSDSDYFGGSGRRRVGKRKTDPVEVTHTGSGYGKNSGSEGSVQDTQDRGGSRFDEYEQSSYTDGGYKDSLEGADKIDAEIAKGKQIIAKNNLASNFSRTQSATKNADKKETKSIKSDFDEL